MALAVGRPELYKEEFCDLLIDHGAQGFSFESFAAKINVNQDTLYEWVKKHPEFSEAKKDMEAHRRLFYEKLGLAGMVGKIPFFKSNIFIWYTKNMLNWRDKIESTVLQPNPSVVNINWHVTPSEKKREDFYDK